MSRRRISGAAIYLGLALSTVLVLACSGSGAKDPDAVVTPPSRTPRSSPGPSGTPWTAPVDLPILMYHHVTDARPPSAFQARLTVTSADFSKQLAYLRCAGYTAVTLSQLFDAMGGGEALPSKAVVLTFDDGYADAFTDAFPLLQKYGFGGTFAVVTGFVGQEDYLTWDQVITMASAGMEIASHSVNHVDLNKSPDQTVRDEVTNSKIVLEQKLGRSVEFFVYPSGEPFRSGTKERQQKVVEMLQKAGYRGALTTTNSLRQDPATPFALSRIRVSGSETLLTFAATIRGPTPRAAGC